MKKINKLLSVLTAVMLFLGCLPPISLTVNATGGHTHHVCGKQGDACTHNEGTTTYQPLTKNDFDNCFDPNGNFYYIYYGEYYLAEDITLELGNVPVIFSGGLCLNGHVLNLNGNYIEVVAGLTITDCNSEAEHRFRVSNGYDFDEDFFPSENLWILDEENGDQVVNGGVITGGLGYQEGYDDGGGIYVGRRDGEGSAYLCMYGGTIAGNRTGRDGGGIHLPGGSTADIRGDAKILGNYASNHGGGICCNSGVNLNVFENAQISYNHASSGGGGIEINYCTVTISDNVEISYNDAGQDGGGIEMRSNCTVTISGNVEISYNDSRRCGGGIAGNKYDNYGEKIDSILNIDGARIINNRANYGAGIGFEGYYTKEVVLKDVIIENNVARYAGGGMNTPNTWSNNYYYSAYGGGLHSLSTPSQTYFFILGNTKIQNNFVENKETGTKTPSNLHIAGDTPSLKRVYANYDKNSGWTYPFVPLSQDARIGVTANSGAKVAQDFDDDPSGCFFADSSGTITLDEASNSLVYNHNHTICGETCTHNETHSALEFTALNDNDIFSNYRGGNLYGNYYLTKAEYDLTQRITVPEGQTLNLCLNGYSLTSANKGNFVIFDVKGTLNLCDCSNGTSHFNEQENGLWKADLNGNKVLSGGTVTRGNSTNGGGVLVESTGTFNLYGGNIVGNTASNGGGVCVKAGGSFNMLGGSLLGNTATADGNDIFNEDGGTTIITHGKFNAQPNAELIAENCECEFDGEFYNVAPHQHTYGEVAYTWSEDYATCTAKRICQKDETHIEQEVVSASIEVTQAQSCKTDEETTYTATFTNPAFATQTQKFKTADKTEHTYDNDEDAICNNCGYERVIATAYTVKIDGVAMENNGSEFTFPVSTEKGFIAYTDNTNYYDVGDVVTIDKNLEFSTIAIGEVKMLEGASIRLAQKSGIRFETQVDTTKLSALPTDSTVEKGTLITLKELATSDLTLNSDYKTVNVKYLADEYRENGTFAGSIVNIQDKNITKDFVGRGYVTVKIGDYTKTVYADYANGDIANNSRSVAFVANRFKTSCVNEYNSLTEEQKILVNKWCKPLEDA